MTLHRRSVWVLVPSVLMMLALVAAQEAPSAGREEPINPESLRPGEIIIRRTGKVRLVKVTPERQPVAATQPAAKAPAKAPADEGMEYTERSVRLPLGYDPAENYSGPGPVLNLPLEDAYPEPYFGGILGGYGYGNDCGYGHAFGRGYGYGNGRNCNYGPGYGFGGFGGGRTWYNGSGSISSHRAFNFVDRSASGVWVPAGSHSAGSHSTGSGAAPRGGRR